MFTVDSTSIILNFIIIVATEATMKPEFEMSIFSSNKQFVKQSYSTQFLCLHSFELVPLIQDNDKPNHKWLHLTNVAKNKGAPKQRNIDIGMNWIELKCRNVFIWGWSFCTPSYRRDLLHKEKVTMEKHKTYSLTFYDLLLSSSSHLNFNIHKQSRQ